MDYTPKINYLDFIDEIDLSIESDNQKCLISYENLDSDSVELICGHKFNYIPLINDVFKQKFIFRKKKYKYINCPYCRQLHTDLLPYYDHLNVIKIFGVNTDDEKYEIIQKSYKYLFDEEPGECCYNFCNSSKKCNETKVFTHLINDKKYCLRHFKLMNKKFFDDAVTIKPIYNNIKETKPKKQKKKIISDHLKCIAKTKQDVQCSFKKKKGDYCTMHSKMNNLNELDLKI